MRTSLEAYKLAPDGCTLSSTSPPTTYNFRHRGAYMCKRRGTAFNKGGAKRISGGGTRLASEEPGGEGVRDLAPPSCCRKSCS
eukprot:CAMPEP_0180554762 /NCGR_PEP_ID=MMETSP1036_2-20121128/75081_1 /TAXON_ID=632150 /ORGANISM="Azadinium spinosum, Strain 3D9" /LENGTH=82 /DNA_ID=CAMNT_0022570563 /DNA_START=659 /DNA_END=908 /DNA_ORIENTATION=+